MESTRQFTQRTSMHGLKYLFEPGYIRKIIWFCLFLISVALLVRQISMQLLQYQNNPLTTNMKIKYLDEVQFPAITICNTNQLKISELAQNDAYLAIMNLYSAFRNPEIFKSYMQNDFPQLLKYNFSVTSSTFEMAKLQVLSLSQTQAFLSLDNRFPDSRSFMHKVTHQQEDTFLKCTTNRGNRCEVQEIYTDKGLCFVINNNLSAPLVATAAGFNERIDVVLNMEQYEFTANELPLAGFQVTLTEPGNTPLLRAMSSKIRAGPASILAITKKSMHLLSVTDYGVHGSCTKSRELEFFPESEYSYDTCAQNSLLVTTQRACGCTPMNAPKEYVEDMCSVSEHFLCVVPMALFPSHELDKDGGFFEALPWLAEEPEKVCLANCSQVQYDVSMSYLDVPPTYIAEYMQKKSIEVKREKAIELQGKLNPTEKLANEKLVKDVQVSYALLKNHSIAVPNGKDVQYVNAREHLRIISPCFDTLNDDTQFEKFVNYYDDNEQWDISFEYMSTYFDPKFLRIFLEEPTVKQILAGYEKYDQPFIVGFLDTFFDEMISYFPRDPSFLAGGENTLGDHSKYDAAIKLMNRYTSTRRNSITKKVWAERHVNQKLVGLGEHYKNALLSPLISALGEYQFQAYTFYNNTFVQPAQFLKSIVQNKTGYDINFWALISYEIFLAHHKFILMNQEVADGACTLTQFQTIVEEFKNEDSISQDKCKIALPVRVRGLTAEAVECISGLGSSNTITNAINEYIKRGDAFVSAMIRVDTTLSAYGQEFKDVDKFYKSNVAYMSISFADMSSQQLEQQISYDIWSLFSDVGGTLGLFLGASVMTFCEIVDWIFTRTTNKVAKKMQRKIDSASPSEETTYPNSEKFIYENDMKPPSRIATY